MNAPPIHRPSVRLISLAVLLCAAVAVILALNFASPRSALADAGGVPTNTPKPTKKPTKTPTVIPTETFTLVPTIQGGGLAATANVAPLLNLATTQAAIIPTSTPLAATSLRTTPALLCAAFAIVLILIVIIVALWLLGRSTPGSNLPTEAPPGY